MRRSGRRCCHERQIPGVLLVSPPAPRGRLSAQAVCTAMHRGHFIGLGQSDAPYAVLVAGLHWHWPNHIAAEAAVSILLVARAGLGSFMVNALFALNGQHFAGHADFEVLAAHAGGLNAHDHLGNVIKHVGRYQV